MLCFVQVLCHLMITEIAISFVTASACICIETLKQMASRNSTPASRFTFRHLPVTERQNDATLHVCVLDITFASPFTPWATHLRLYYSYYIGFNI